MGNGRTIKVLKNPVTSPPQTRGPQSSQQKLTAAVRPQWTPEKLESLISDKIMAKTNASEGQVLPAMRLFVGSGNEISLKDFESTLSRLLNVDFQEGEVQQLFNKYDQDGGGTLDVAEFVAAVFPSQPLYGGGPPRTPQSKF